MTTKANEIQNLIFALEGLTIGFESFDEGTITRFLPTLQPVIDQLIETCRHVFLLANQDKKCAVSEDEKEACCTILTEAAATFSQTAYEGTFIQVLFRDFMEHLQKELKIDPENNPAALNVQFASLGI